jgi:SAM-dependent methyltransferase
MKSAAMNMQTTDPLNADLTAVMARQKAAWSSGDYSIVGTTLQIVGETLCEAVDLRAGERVLDVAAGNGNATLAAARRFAEVVSTDYVRTLVDHGRERAKADRLPVTFLEADAEDLPFETGSFDVVLSTFGVMFVANHEKAASELLRVCRPGARIGLASWTPKSFIGRLFGLMGQYVPPAVNVRSPGLWGTKASARRVSPRNRGHSCFATGRPNTGSRSSAPITGRCARPLRQSIRVRARRSKTTSAA